MPLLPDLGRTNDAAAVDEQPQPVRPQISSDRLHLRFDDLRIEPSSYRALLGSSRVEAHEFRRKLPAGRKPLVVEVSEVITAQLDHGIQHIAMPSGVSVTAYE